MSGVLAAEFPLTRITRLSFSRPISEAYRRTAIGEDDSKLPAPIRKLLDCDSLRRVVSHSFHSCAPDCCVLLRPSTLPRSNRLNPAPYTISSMLLPTSPVRIGERAVHSVFISVCASVAYNYFPTQGENSGILHMVFSSLVHYMRKASCRPGRARILLRR